MNKLLSFILMNKTVVIAGIVGVTVVSAASVFAIVESRKNHILPSATVSVTTQIANSTVQDLESAVSQTVSSETSEVNTSSIPLEQVKIKPSTGSVLTAPEFSYNPEEDVQKDEVNAEKFAPQTPSTTQNSNTNTVNPNVKKIEPTDNSVNVRADAGTKYQSLGKVSIGQVFDYLGEKVGTDGMVWYNISGVIGGKQQSGYIRSDYAKYSDVAPTPKDNFRFEVKGGKTYCYKNDELLKGYADVNGLRYYFNKETGAKESYTCIDVSKYQGNINWSSVKAAGVEYAIIRVGFRGYGSAGNLCIDPYFEQNIKGAKAAGIKCGVYFYSAAKNVIEAAEEAMFTLNAINGYSLDLPIAFDTELVGERLEGLSAKQRTDNAIAFMETIKQAGHSVMLYTYFNFYNNNLEKSRLTDYTLWMAYYTDNSGLLGNMIYDGWQYASDGSVSGVTGRCDMNVIFESMITGNRNDNPIITKKEEETKPETSSETSSQTNSEISSEINSETSSQTNSEISSEINSETSSENISEQS